MTAPTKAKRLPRYRRAATKVNFVLTERDLEILAVVESYRLLTSELIQLLIDGSCQGILRRLQLLFQAGYLDRLRPPYVVGGGSAKMIYAIANQGARILQKEGRLQALAKTDLNAQNRELHEFFIRHRLLVSHIRAIFTAACGRDSGLELVTWREGTQIRDRIEVALPQGYTEVPVAADGFFTLRDAKGRTHYFVEADRGSMQIKRFLLKLKAYAAYYRQRKHAGKFDIQHFRVLTVTSSAARSANLVAAAALDQDVRELHPLFLFTTEEQLPLAYPENVFEPIWTKPGVEEPCSLFGQAESGSRNTSITKEAVIVQRPFNPNPEDARESR